MSTALDDEGAARLQHRPCPPFLRRQQRQGGGEVDLRERAGGGGDAVGLVHHRLTQLSENTEFDF